MTRSLPRPRMRCGQARAPGRTGRAPRSSNGLWTVANRSAGPPTRIVVNRASGSSRDVLTPIRRWMSDPIAIGVERRVAGRRHAQPRRAMRRSMRRRRRAAARRAARGEHQVGDRLGRTGPAERRGPPRTSPGALPGRRAAPPPRAAPRPRSPHHRRVGRRRPRRAAGVGALMAGRVRIGHDDDRQPEGGHLGQRGRAGAPDDEVGRGQGREHLVAQERVRPVASRGARRAAPRGRPARRRSRRHRSRGSPRPARPAAAAPRRRPR